MIIIGGKNSSNTKQLVNICQSECVSCYHIESEDELKKDWFVNKKLCGITAGASTPDWIIQKVFNKIKKFNEVFSQIWILSILLSRKKSYSQSFLSYFIFSLYFYLEFMASYFT